MSQEPEQPPSTPRAEEPLAFDRADFRSPDAPEGADEACHACGRSIEKTYFTINDAITCEDCHHLVTAQLKEGKSGTAFLRAAGLGAVAAACGSIAWYAVAKITGMEIGLLAIGIGLLVGYAVRRGSRVPGARRYQALAMLLTYVSITFSYLPLVFKTLSDAPTHESAAAASSAPPSTRETPPREDPPGASGTPAPPGSSPSAASSESPGPLGVVVALVLMVGITLAAPFLAGAKNIIGILLIGIALYEAWKINKPAPIVITGPQRARKAKR